MRHARVLHTSIEQLEAKTFRHWHQVVLAGELMCEGTEARAFISRDPANPGCIEAIPIPGDIKARCL